MILFFVSFFAVNILVNYYIYKRAKQAFNISFKNEKTNSLFHKIFFIIFWFIAFSYPIARSMSTVMNNAIYDMILWIGSFWFAFMLYLFLLTLIIDLIRGTNKLFHFLPDKLFINYEKTKRITGAIVLLITVIIIGYGHFNASNIKLKRIEIEIQKKSAEVDSLKIVFFADTHLTPVNNGRVLDKVVSIINSCNADAVVMAGDVVDDLAHHLYRYKLDKKLLQINSKYGVIMANGNHEWIVGIDNALSFLKKSKIIVLRDTVLTIANSLQIIGREDKSLTRYVDYDRKTIEQLVYEADSTLPILILDHQPFELKHNSEAGIDIQLSGHTHHGQMFPANLITSMIYEISWGYQKINNTHFYVTSGAGTWGSPVRTGSDAEIIEIIIRFK